MRICTCDTYRKPAKKFNIRFNDYQDILACALRLDFTLEMLGGENGYLEKNACPFVQNYSSLNIKMDVQYKNIQNHQDEIFRFI